MFIVLQECEQLAGDRAQLEAAVQELQRQLHESRLAHDTLIQDHHQALQRANEAKVLMNGLP